MKRAVLLAAAYFAAQIACSVLWPMPEPADTHQLPGTGYAQYQQFVGDNNQFLQQGARQ